MAKKDSKMTFQYWAEIYAIEPSVSDGVKAAEDITNTTRMTENEFKSIVKTWLSRPVKGESNG
jgi:hypothetical protein